MDSPLWTEVAPSRFPWEREALAFLKAGLPNHEPWRAWTNFEFVAENGSINDDRPVAVLRSGAARICARWFSAAFFEEVAFDEVRDPVLPLRHGPSPLSDE